MLVDSHGRAVNYMRISVTDRCNLRCFYCRSNLPLRPIRHEEMLRYEEILDLMRLAGDLGVKKIRLTGGEPFIRRGFMDFLEKATALEPKADIRLTTNGTRILEHIPHLKDLGVDRLNISLDSMQQEKFHHITGADEYTQVRKAIDSCLKESIHTKINVVALRSVNDDELADFLAFARENPVDVRFIEFMPVGGKTLWNKDYFWSADDILAAARNSADLEPVRDKEPTAGPAGMFSILGGQGRLGVISPLSHHFCDSCNRLRITCDGRLRTCLFSDTSYRLLPLLRSRLKDPLRRVKKVVGAAQARKPLGYKLLHQEDEDVSVCRTVMSSIGG